MKKNHLLAGLFAASLVQASLPPRWQAWPLPPARKTTKTEATTTPTPRQATT